ncbi:ABC transporter substrate-binding protein [Mesorhizobium delmotii]|uniref:Extracellular solute-binding protein family 5 n=1 Tax=Mesorhizobium delmotii TaxID=1631247 RepID=A0A2P9AMA0_9HYPH|nr:ABC transporter substrate-binding protein [Mesorhizobium delmotii]SJM32266.1 Extracellular solute-binding protein family 5 [Mesorhizobium delmotii]
MRKLFAAFAVMAMLSPGAATAQNPPTGGTFSLPINDDPQMWPLAGGLYNILVGKALYSGLVRYNLETLDPVGDLAESWTVSEDGRTYTFALRKNVKWHDGEPFDADDVVFTVKLWTNKAVPFYLANNFRLIESVTATDSSTVVIKLTKPQAAFPVLLGYNASILPEHLLKNLTPEQLINPTEFLKKPIGTGPFKFEQYQPGSFVRLVRNDDYFDGKAKLDAMVFRIVPDANSQLALLRAGEVDLAVIEPFQLSSVANTPGIKIQSVPIVRSEYIALNNSVGALSDKRVRTALTLGLNRELLLKTVFQGRGTIATGPFPPSVSWAHNADIKPLPFDPKQTQALLDEAGWKVGADGVRTKDGQLLTFTVLYDPSNPTRARTALIAQQQWNAIGVKTTFETSEYRAIVERMRQRPPAYQINPNYQVTPPDPDGVANNYLSNSLANESQYKRPEIDNLLDQGATAQSREERAKIYKRVQEIIHEDQPIVYTVDPDEIQALSAKVESFPKAGYRDALAWSHLIVKR